jgi:hypothetical protein
VSVNNADHAEHERRVDNIYMAFSKNKIGISLFALGVLVTAISGSIGYGKKEHIAKTPDPQESLEENLRYAVREEGTTADATEHEKTKHEPQIVYTSVDNFVSPTTADVKDKIIVRLIVEDFSVDLSVQEQTTVLALLEQAEAAGYIHFSSRDYGGDLGHLVEEINGIRSSTRDKKYWIYYINGKKASIGVSNYIVRPGDIISWKYENETI